MILSAGTMLQDRYEILEKIGSGGMSEVYKAKCHKLNRLVAIKVLKLEFTYDAGFVSKFKMEAQAAAGLSHPNIVSIYDVVDEGDIHFIVMELVEGITLKSYIQKKGRLDVRESIGIALQVAQGIAAAHEQHIIHRDIKPQNMLISRDGKVKVADFGIARAVSSQTMNSTVVGSVHYISPEQARGGYSDERSDIYSLGITMFEMVTGKLPFEGDNTVTVALAHLEDPLPLPGSLNPEVTPGLEKIILKCTEKRPEDRYYDVSQVIDDLRRVLLAPEAVLPSDVPELPDIPAAQESHSQGTITISKKELDIIKGRSAMHPENRTARERGERRKAGDPGRRETDQRYRQEREESTSLEKLLTALGVLAAILVVAVVIVIFSRLGGLFQGTTPEEESRSQTAAVTTEARESEEDEESLSQKEVRMPLLVGDTEDEAEATLEALDLTMRIEYESSDEVEKGVVISQYDEEGSVVSRYSEVRVVVSSGSDKVEIGSLGLTEMSLDTAVRLLEGKSLKTAVVEEASDTVEQGSIIRFEPEDRAALGSTVTLYVSTGPEVEMVLVPDLEGADENDVPMLLEEVGLLTGQISREHSSTVEAGTVISQGIEYDTEVEVGTAVDYVVSLGPEAPKTQFVASLEASYPLMVSYGPGAASSEIQILIRLKQTVNGKVTYTKLVEPKSYNADTILEIQFDRIRGADGVLTGEVEIVDLTNNVVLTSYNVTFQEVQVSG